ncbi:Transposase IS4 [Popillia japonica]|uniref:Transposase IS4 n=1 Tax=Popillia japonica TaxID=7064 RepID=A0AAW1IUN4_POPJA
MDRSIYREAVLSKYNKCTICTWCSYYFVYPLYLVNETRNDARFKNSADPHITSEEIKCAIGVFILSGYGIKPARRFYWDSKSDLGNPMVKNAIRKNRFEQVMQFVLLADNNNPVQNDKWKIRPLMDKLEHALLKYFVPEENINYDESMVKYFERYGLEQFIRGKPIRVGYKM